MRSSHENLITWVSNIDSRLRHLEQKVEERLYDTRPIWQKVLADINQVREGQAQLEKTLRAETGEIKNSLLDLYRGQGVLNDAILKLHRDYHQIDGRIHELEFEHNQQNSST